MNDQPMAKRLIEVAMPVKEISAESVRDKSIRHGHISTLHLWWARRPLPVCRGVVFASLVPDPLDESCPPAFRDAVQLLLSGPEYKPYADIPFTAVVDPMEDNLRNRLLMFIGSFSAKFLERERQGKKCPPKEQLSDACLIKWESRTNHRVLTLARKLIWVAHNSTLQPDRTAKQHLSDFNTGFASLQEAEQSLYSRADRHVEGTEVEALEKKLDEAREAFLDKMPRVFDPFAGGGAIPLEVARLGCRSYGNDINPVAHIIQKGSLEFPQRFGKPIRYTRQAFIAQYGEEALRQIPREDLLFAGGDVSGVSLSNRLSWDVEHYAHRLLNMVKETVGHYYPDGPDGKTPIAYYWARVGTCANPTCGAEVPLLRQLYLAKTKSKRVYLKPILNGKEIEFSIEKGESGHEGWMERANLRCPVCGNVTDVKTLKESFTQKLPKEKVIAVIEDGKSGKEYRLPSEKEKKLIEKIEVDRASFIESMDNGNYRDLKLPKWGFSYWHEMFNNRQLLTLQTFVDKLQELRSELDWMPEAYRKAVVTYLAIWVDRIAIANTSFGRWHVGRETLEHPFSRQAIPMVFDYPESNPFCDSTGGGKNQLAWIIRYLNSESISSLPSSCINASSGEKGQFPGKFLDAVVTDPPYYDAIAYADLSDFFYIWLKRTIGEEYPLNFAYPQAPKTEECTALKHHHEGNADQAFTHFEDKLRQIFTAIEHQTKGVVSIMFAHQSTQAWTTLVNSILGSNMNITSSWPFDSEMGSRMIAIEKAALASSVTVSCRPTVRKGYGDFKKVRETILSRVKKEVDLLYNYGFRGADLLTACFGQAVSEFGQYKAVEKASGDRVSVAELLEMAREAAFNAIVSDIDTDDVTRFYIGWLNLFSFTKTEHDSVRKVTQIGLDIDVAELQQKVILVTDGNKQVLASYQDRVAALPRLGMQKRGHIIDQVHKAMHLFEAGNRRELLAYIAGVGAAPEGIFWRVLSALVEVLPAGIADYEQATGLLTNKDSLIRDAKQVDKEQGQQMGLFEG